MVRETQFSFLMGGGEMGALMRAHEWSNSSVGSPHEWSQALRTAVRLLLNCGHPMYIFWGPQGACFYNDAYRQSIGPERHPASLGQPARDVWAEIWDIIGPQVDQVMAGHGATWHENQLVPITRNGVRDDVYWTYSYSPIDDDTAPNHVGGVLVVCSETTQAVLAQRRAEAEHLRLMRALEHGPTFISGKGELSELIRNHDWTATSLGPLTRWPQSLKTATGLLLQSAVPIVMLWGEDGIMIYNDAYSMFAGSRHPHLLGSKVREGWPEVADFNDHVMKVCLAGGTLTYKDQELTLYRSGVPEQVWMDLYYSPVLDEQGVPGGVIAFVVETTEQVLAERGRAAEQARQRQLLTQMPGFAAVLAGPAHVFEYVNDAFINLAARQNFLGRSFEQVFPDLDGQGFSEMLHKVFTSGERVINRAMQLRLHGSAAVQYIDFVFEPIRTEAGIISGIFVGGYEVTEAHRAAAALRAMNADLEKQVVERAQERGLTWQVSPDLLAVASHDGLFESVNPAWMVTLGWSAEQLVHSSCALLVHPDHKARMLRIFALLQKGIPQLRFENRYRHADGSYRWLSWVAVPVNEKIYCSARDITVEKAAAAERDHLWTLSQDMLARADYSGSILAVNPAWTHVLGWTERELLTNPYADIIHPDDLDVTLAALVQMGRTGQPTRFENRIQTSKGEWKPIGWTVSPEPDRVNFIAVGRDLADYKARERELLEAQEALRQSQKMEAVGQLTGGIAHDFNNLLAAISGNLELLDVCISKGRVDSAPRHINSAQDAARRAATLTQRLLAFSRRQTLDPRPIDVNKLMTGMEELIKRTVGPTIEAHFLSANNLWATRVDPSQLENSLLNLCINARDAIAPDSGHLTIEVSNKWLDERAAHERDLSPGQYVAMYVTDTGRGMSPEVVARAFDPFFTTKPLGQGTGLGLSMIYGFVRQSGGQVRIHSDLGKGTTMCLYLPRHFGVVEVSEEITVNNQVEHGKGETVLVIDDEVLVRMLITDLLQDSGYQALEAVDGPTGLKILQSETPIDLLITDVGLPGGLNGRQVADAARQTRPDLKVLFVTGYAANAVIGNHLDPGMEVITKPFVVADLKNKILEMIER